MKEKFKHFEILTDKNRKYLFCQPDRELKQISDSIIQNRLKAEYGENTFAHIIVVRKDFYKNYFAFCSITGCIPSYRMAKIRYRKTIWMTVFSVLGKTALIYFQLFWLGRYYPVLHLFLVSILLGFIVYDIYRLYLSYRLTYLIYVQESLNKILETKRKTNK